MSNDFSKVLVRLTLAVDGAGLGRLVEVETRDLWELIRDHARLDAEARLTYGPHVARTRQALEVFKDNTHELLAALYDMPSRDVLLARVDVQIRGETT